MMEQAKMEDLKQIETEKLVGMIVAQDRKQKQGSRLLNRYKAEFERRGTRVMEDLNTHYVEFFGGDGQVSVTDSSKMDILNPDKLKGLIGEGVYSTRIRENVKTDYKVDPKLQRALKAIFQKDYTFEQSLDEFLQTLDPQPDTAQRSLLLKKLKGDYAKDRETLLQVLNLPGDMDLDVELWYIYKIKNAELIKAFLPEEGIDFTMEELRKCLLVDSKSSVTINYEEEET